MTIHSLFKINWKNNACLSDEISVNSFKKMFLYKIKKLNKCDNICEKYADRITINHNQFGLATNLYFNIMYAAKDDKDELIVRDTIPLMAKFTNNSTGYCRSWKNYEINNLAV